MREEVSSWAQKHAIDVAWPEQFREEGGAPGFMSLGETYDFRANVCIDYGKFIERIPFFVVRPTTIEQVLVTVAFLNEQAISYKVRGAAHSAGGQVLTDSGAVLDLSKLAGIVDDSPDTEEITVEGGIWWLHVAEHLHDQSRRPAVLTDNLRTTVAGTLSVGGFGDTTHLYGLQIASVTALKLITPDARMHRLTPPDELFRYALAGRGQFGIIAEAKLKTLRRASNLALRLLEWNSVADYVEDALRIIETGLYEFCRMRILYQPQSLNRNPVKGVAGHFMDGVPSEDASGPVLRHARAMPYETLHFLKHYSQDPTETWTHCSPAVEMIFPLPAGIRTWQQINRKMIKSGLFRHLNRGSSIMVLRNDRALPLAPLPDADFCMMIAIRPEMSLRAVGEYIPMLHEIQADALEAGAKIYMMSIEPNAPDFLERQFGSALPEIIALKRRLDPKSLLNPGLLP